jgi:DNA-binding CsgD family transcriptional regulator
LGNPDGPGTPDSGRKRWRVILGVDGLTARPGDHIVHLYQNPSDILRILGPYIATGLRNHERCLVCATRCAEPLRVWLAARGVAVDEMEGSGQLVMVAGEPTAIGQNKLMHRIVTETEGMGYPLLRLGADGDGVLGDLASPDELLRWEDIFDQVFAPTFPMVTLCQFDLTRFRGDAVLEILRTHPLSLIGDKVVRSPFYDPPRQYGLTPREKQVLQLLAHGHGDKEVAKALSVSTRTIESHVANILDKMHAKSRTDAVAMAIRAGIVE